MHVAVHVGSAQWDGQIEEAYLLDDFRRKEPQSPAVEHHPQEGRCYLHAPFRQEHGLQTMVRVVEVTAVVCQDGTQLGPEPLTYLKLTPPGQRSLISVHIMLTGNLSRFENLISEEINCVRSASALETYLILEKEVLPRFMLQKLGGRKGSVQKMASLVTER